MERIVLLFFFFLTSVKSLYLIGRFALVKLLNIYKICMEQKDLVPKANLKKEIKAGGNTILEIKLYFEVAVINTVW